ncbi:MAG: hypothetical protein ACKPJJ_06385 [Planctomycetaceae bacterium]
MTAWNCADNGCGNGLWDVSSGGAGYTNSFGGGCGGCRLAVGKESDAGRG